MITDTLKTILTKAGCSKVIYDQEQLVNLYADAPDSSDVIGIIMRPPDVILEVRANAIAEHYNPLMIEVVQQARLEDKAEENEAQLQELLDICKKVIVYVIGEAEFKTILPMTLPRVLESKYDANVIGWAMPFNLYWLKNETREPCL